MQRREPRMGPGDIAATEKGANGAAESIAAGGTPQAGRGEDLLHNVVDTSREGMILIDGQGRILLFNPACERIFGYRRDEVMGQSATMLMRAPGDREFDRSFTSQSDRGEAAITAIALEDVVGLRKDGSSFPMRISVGAPTQSGEPIVFGIIRDLTDVERPLAPPKSLSMVARTRRQRIEREAVQSQRMEAVGRLSGGIAHDFNNLLTVIIGHADLLAENLRGNETQAKWAGHIIAAAERAAELTQRLLSFGRKQLLRPAEIDCNKLVDSMRELLGRTLRNDIRIAAHLEPDLAPAYADPSQLQSALLVLAHNARDAMPQAGTLTFTTENVTLDADYFSLDPGIPPGAYVLIAVTDDGEGMPPAVRARAFEPFFTTRDVGKGSGLGLSMVHGFAKQSNGHVTLQSEPGLGTTVRLYLPASPASAAAAAPPVEAPAVPSGQGTVLVVEDDPFVRGYGVTCLRSLGYRVISAADGDEALVHLAGPERIDLLFGDVVLSGSLNGSELAARAKQVRPAIKVLLTSAYTLDTLAERGRLNGYADVLNKPYRRSDLDRRVRETLAGR